MKRFLSSVSLVVLLILSLSQKISQQTDNSFSTDYSRAEQFYKEAGGLSASANNDEKIQQLQDVLFHNALKFYEVALSKSIRSGFDSLSFHSFIKIGLISTYFDSTNSARNNYLNAIALKSKLPGISDSFLFKPYLFLGGILYQENEFDSASMCYQKAEEILNKYGTVLEESQRLYNRQGALYYESGNYRLAKNYFEKALGLLSPADASYLPLRVNYQMNIASISVKLEQYDEAKRIYESLLRYRLYENEIWHNIGIIDNHLGKFNDAVNDLRRVKYSNSKNIDLDYNLALAFDSLRTDDSVQFYIQKASAENSKFNAQKKNTAWGLVLKLAGDRNQEHKKYLDALKDYQAAIIQFDPQFSNGDILKNPQQFSGIFSYINLFKTLSAKAKAHELLYDVDKDKTNLESSLDAYRAAFKLADYVGKTYESDEARLFLNDIKYSAHNNPIDVCLELYDLTHQVKYLEEAYLFDQRNKASILTFNLQVAGQTGISTEIISKVRELKIAITRLTLRAAQSTDSSQVAQINRQVSTYEIQLARLQQQLNNDTKYAQLQPSEWVPTIDVVQTKILDADGAIVSYHLSPKELVVFVITKNAFECQRQAIKSDFLNAVNSFAADLRKISAGEKYQGDSVSRTVYAQLIRPIFPFIRNSKRLIIIPADELNYIPFEALKSEANRYLLESFSIQYQYSTALLNIRPNDKGLSLTQTLAIAPFANSDGQSKFEPLKYSGAEVEGLQGKILEGSRATKENFLTEANHYKIIHLATHANADDESPLRSSIIFFPSGPDSSYHLYAQEIYNLRLDSTQLVVLSACETGTGPLIRGEGLMSLSRAISYAGCPNIVTSLWKAQDQTTAFITKRLHFYLEQDYSNDEALRQAKLDLLRNKDIEPQFKTPNYWAHLIFIGNYRREAVSHFIWWMVAGIVIIAIALLLYQKRKTWLNQPGKVLHRD